MFRQLDQKFSDARPRLIVIDHSQLLSTMLDPTRPRSTILDHGCLAFNALGPIDLPFLLDLGQSIDRSWSIIVNHGWPSAINQPRGQSQSIDQRSAARIAYSHKVAS